MKFFEISIFTLLINPVYSILFTSVVKIEQGSLRGIRTSLGINRYLGIQYATSERFQPPQKPKGWTGIYDAIDPLNVCPQSAKDQPEMIIGSGECLYLDVFTPENAKPGDKIPVFVFIHGGGYSRNDKGFNIPDFLVTKNIVAVDINYRVGLLGFLCVNGVANLGLKDQSAALKWVQKNIAAFGGDPDNVTLAGQSAGSVAVSLHMLSEQSAGLFHKAILLSGFALAPWAFNVDPLRPALQDANKISVARTEEEIFEVFATAPLVELLLATSSVLYNSRYFKYSPCVDSHLPDPFFRDTPYEIIKSGHFNKVPVMIGVTNREGIYFYGDNTMTTFAEWNADFENRLPQVFNCSKEDRELISQKMRSYYFGDQLISEEAVQSTVNYYTDWIDHATFDAFAQLLAHYSRKPLYKYVFSYDGARNFAKMSSGKAAALLQGAGHSDDLFYLSKPLGLSLTLTEDDKLFIEKYTTIVGNFIKFSDPIPHTSSLLPVTWPSSTSNISYIMHLDQHLNVTTGPYKKDNIFLGLLCQYGLQGYVPCESAQQC